MTLAELLKDQVPSRGADALLIHYVDAFVEPDISPEHVRLFLDPRNHRSWLLVNKLDIVGELYAWTPQELVAAHCQGVQVYRIPVKHGAMVLDVVVKPVRLGEDISAEAQLSAAGDCKQTSGCTTGCCTSTNGGKCYCDKCCIG